LNHSPMKLFLSLGRLVGSELQREVTRSRMRFLFFSALLIAVFAFVRTARAQDLEDGDPDTLADATASDSSNQVLEIPQQCDPDSVAFLCDRSSDASSEPDADVSLAGEPDTGSVYDYANQNIINDVSNTGTTNLPVGVLGYVPLLPAPAVVQPIGPGTYEQWASGPGTYQQFAPGPGFVSPIRPYGPAMNFGPRPLNNFGGGRFGHR